MLKRMSCLQVFILISIGHLFAQSIQSEDNPVFNYATVATVRIYIDPDTLDWIMDEANLDSDHEFSAQFIFENHLITDTVDNVGFRLRGNTSRQAQKKSFKVSFNTFVPGGDFYGLEKLNLNSEHNDPSIIRAKLCWDIFNDYGVAAPRANHVKLYINDRYFGLYINVEHIDERFVRSRFGNNNGNLYKCLWPADLTYISENPEDYKFEQGNRRTYDLKINQESDDYSDLANFIDILNNTSPQQFPDVLEKVFDVNSFLKTMAVDAAVASWDNYWFLKNNYYLYRNTATGRFEFIPYDYDNTFGVWWDGILPGVDWGTRDVYNWGNPAESRPLVERLLDVARFRDRYSYFLKELIENNFNIDMMSPRVDSLHTMISAAAEADSFRTFDYGYTVEQFHASYDQALGDHVTYGLKPYIETRSASILQNLEAFDIAPLIGNVATVIQQNTVIFEVVIEDDAPGMLAQIIYGWDGQVPTEHLLIADDGGGADLVPDDKVFTGQLAINTSAIRLDYYVVSMDNKGKYSFFPYDAPQTLLTIDLSPFHVPLYLNEFMASNDSAVADEFGEYDDWIEIYNGGDSSIWLGDKYLTDDFIDTTKWNLPDTLLAAGAFLLIWADDDTLGLPLHAPYKLDRDGEAIGIFYKGQFIDSLSFGFQETDISMARTSDGTGNWLPTADYTPGYSNTATAILPQINKSVTTYQLDQNYPNPFNPSTVISYALPAGDFVTLKVYDTGGRVVQTLVDNYQPGGRYAIRFNAVDLASGIYFYHLNIGKSFSQTRKMLLVK